MLELHQFRHSAFCLKVRMGLAAKGLTYKIVEITPGIGQIAIFRKSGQRQVPVLIDEENIVTESSAIIRYIEKRHPEPKLIPTDLKTAAQVHLIEEWADTTLASRVRSSLLQAISIDPSLRIGLLSEELPTPIRKVIEEIPYALFAGMGELISQGKGSFLIESLERLTNLVQTNSWLVGEEMTVADIAIAAQLSLLKFPPSSGHLLEGKGCPGFNDNPRLQPLFHWRDNLENLLLLQSSQMT